MSLHTSLPFRCTDGLDYVGTHYPSHKNNVYIDCPCCGGKKKMNAVLSGSKEHLFHCVKCGASANTISYVAEVRGIGNDEAYQEICNYANVPTYERTEKPAPAPKKEVKEETVPLLPIKQRGAVYRNLLKFFTLEEQDRQALIKRGFSEEAIEKLGYKTYGVSNYKVGSKIAKELEEKGLPLKGVPGTYKYKNSRNLIAMDKPCITVSYRDYNARIQGMQLRFRDKQEGLPRYLWLSSSNKYDGPFSEGSGGSFLHFATDFTWDKEETINKAVLGKTIVLTEGALKADLFHHLTGAPCLAVPGVNSYKCFEEIIPLLKEKGVEEIILAFDMDYIDKPEVARAEEKIREIIESNGFRFKRAKWNPEFKGIDDYYAFKKKGIH